MLNIDKSKWNRTKLGETADDISERVDDPSSSKYNKFVGLDHFVSGDLRIKNWGSTDSLVSAMKLFKTGDVLFARRNAHLRRASMVEFDGVCSGDAFVLRENHKKIVPGFLPFILNTDALWDYAIANAAGTMSKRVKWRDLAEYEFLLPPKEQQTKIAELLWAADNHFETYKKVENKLQLLKSSTLKHIMLGKDLLGGRRITKIGEIPNDWETIAVYDIRNKDDRYSFTGGPFGSDLKSIHYTLDGVRIIQLQNIGEGEFLNDYSIFTSEEKSDQLKSCNIYPGEIILAKMDPVARCCIVPNSAKRFVMCSDGIRLSIDKAKYDNDFIYYALNTQYFRYFAETKKIGSTRGRISLGDLKSLEIAIPKSIELQKRIAKRLKTIDENITLIRSVLAEHNRLLKMLIDQFFN